VRTGFFEPDQLRDVLRHLPEDVQPIVRFAYLTGWRVTSEVLPLQWRHDFAGNEIRLDAGTTKNDDGRVFPMTRELRALLEDQQRSVLDLAKRGTITPWVFHRHGRPIKTFVRRWREAYRWRHSRCDQARCPQRIDGQSLMQTPRDRDNYGDNRSSDGRRGPRESSETAPVKYCLRRNWR
jgi:integrase